MLIAYLFYFFKVSDFVRQVISQLDKSKLSDESSHK